MLGKRKMLILVSIPAALFIFLMLFQQYCDYDVHGLCWQYWDRIGIWGEYLIIFIPLFFLSCIAYFLPAETYRLWIKFAYVWIPLTMLAIFLAPEYGSPFLPITKGSIAGVSSLFFIVISIGIMVFKWVSSTSKK
jgi:hypothetical protein